jgi:ATP-binding cassette subfamily B protein
MPPRSVTAPASATSRATTSLWRLRGYLRPYAVLLAIMLVAAMGMVAASLAIPLVIGRIIDGPIAEGDRSAILRWACWRWRWGCWRLR